MLRKSRLVASLKVRLSYSEATINNNDPVNEKYLTKIITYFLSQRIYRFIILFKKIGLNDLLEISHW